MEGKGTVVNRERCQSNDLNMVVRHPTESKWEQMFSSQKECNNKEEGQSQESVIETSAAEELDIYNSRRKSRRWNGSIPETVPNELLNAARSNSLTLHYSQFIQQLLLPPPPPPIANTHSDFYIQSTTIMYFTNFRILV